MGTCTTKAAVLFPDHPHQVDLGNRRKRLLSPYRYEWEQDGVRYRLTAPEGFEHDGASVPRLAWSILPPHSLDRAAPFHDLHYQRGGVMRPGEHQYLIDGEWRDVGVPWTRAQSDRFFRVLLFEDPRGPSPWSTEGAVVIVRAFGRGSWQDSGPVEQVPDPAE